jgi:hypothetical protein
MRKICVSLQSIPSKTFVLMNLVKTHFTASILCLFSSILLASFSFPDGNTFRAKLPTAQGRDSLQKVLIAENTTGQKLFDSLGLEAKGLSAKAFEYAYEGYQNLCAENRLNNDQFLTIVDFSQSSRSKRFYLVDVKNCKLVLNTYVAHGKNSGVDQAAKFSNVPESNQSSLGFYVTKNTYTGKHGLSLRLAGMEAGFNDKAEARAIVVHGAEYVNSGRVNSAYMGRSQGCPALPEDVSAKVIDLIKDGSAMFLYYPSTEYLSSSRVINS